MAYHVFFLSIQDQLVFIALQMAAGLKCRDSALFRHEIAYVLGQMQQPAAAPQLIDSLRDAGENTMVRHECAEALGAIAADDCEAALRQHLDDAVDVVRDSCIVALDMTEYEHAGQFEYADGLQRIDCKNVPVNGVNWTLYGYYFLAYTFTVIYQSHLNIWTSLTLCTA